MAKLALQDSIETLVYRYLCDLLKNDAVLGRVVKKWRLWKGDLNDYADPTDKDCPCVELFPTAVPAHVLTERSTNSPVAFRLRTTVGGTNCDDVLNLWCALENAIYPNDGTTKAKLDTLVDYRGSKSIPKINLTRPGVGPAMSPDGTAMLYGEGVVTVNLWKATAS